MGRPDDLIRLGPSDAGREGTLVESVLEKLVEAGVITAAEGAVLATKLEAHREAQDRSAAGSA